MDFIFKIRASFIIVFIDIVRSELLTANVASLFCEMLYLRIVYTYISILYFIFYFEKESISRITCIYSKMIMLNTEILGSIVVSIPACHAGDRGSIPRRGGHFFHFLLPLCLNYFLHSHLFSFIMFS